MLNRVANAALLIASLSSSTVEDAAVVVACSYFFRSLGGSLCIGISSAILQQTLHGQLAFRLPDDDQARQVEERVWESPDYMKELPPHVAAEVRMSYQRAVVWATVSSVVFTFVALFSVVLSKREQTAEIAGSHSMLTYWYVGNGREGRGGPCRT